MEKVKLFFALVIVTILLTAGIVTGWLSSVLNSPSLTILRYGETNITPLLVVFVYGVICLGVLALWIKLFSSD